uniref:BAH domain-containing protein n=1 Tax=Lactuca sativa TaxID=4236 RepID=A0A9R1UGN3_LACSA|nr:hypothetical protein LSAT_V11C900460010 [Lactuca sativa]
MPHLLLYGPPGIGKTSTILAVARKLFGTQMHNMVLELNASDERGIDVLRQQIQDVFEHLPIQKKGDSRLVKVLIFEASTSIDGDLTFFAAGDCVLMRPSDSDKPPYVARVEKLEADHRNSVKVRVRWYYCPDHYDMQSAHTIQGKCIVHSFKNYTKLDNVGTEDYFCGFEYKATTGGSTPDRVAVYCKCEMPYNPDDLMVQCEGCKDWYDDLLSQNDIMLDKKEHLPCLKVETFGHP